ncbi:MAG: nucleotidyltransferase domain-containing protein [Alphaproteobacteria bacterium]|nr:nucleotidyltransferase domain-containing protein [Alphaproteobacteria bacterium]
MIPAAVRERIEAALDGIEREHDVQILLAVESGSRAWGFPSPDSDYDVRFIYLRPLDWYVSLSPRRDVIELPIAGDLDIAGWDLRKAMGLLLKGNPALLEWLCSPIVYRARPEAAAIRGLAERGPHRHAARHHYLSLARSQHARWIAGRETVSLKKYFYCLRPALALMWLRTGVDRVPMDLSGLLAGVTLEPEILSAIDDLLTLKATSTEMGEGPRLASLDRLIEDELSLATRHCGEPPPMAPEFLADAEALFRTIVFGSAVDYVCPRLTLTMQSPEGGEATRP